MKKVLSMLPLVTGMVASNVFAAPSAGPLSVHHYTAEMQPDGDGSDEFSRQFGENITDALDHERELSALKGVFSEIYDYVKSSKAEKNREMEVNVSARLGEVPVDLRRLLRKPNLHWSQTYHREQRLEENDQNYRKTFGNVDSLWEMVIHAAQGAKSIAQEQSAGQLQFRSLATNFGRKTVVIVDRRLLSDKMKGLADSLWQQGFLEDPQVSEYKGIKKRSEKSA